MGAPGFTPAAGARHSRGLPHGPRAVCIHTALMSLVVVIFGTPPIVTKLMAMMFGPAFVRKQPAAARAIHGWHLAA